MLTNRGIATTQSEIKINTLDENLQILYHARKMETNPERIKYLGVILELIGQQGDAGRKADLAAQLVNQLMKKVDAPFWQLREVEMTLKMLHSRLGENSETLTYIANKNVSSSSVTTAKLERLTQEFLDLKQVVLAQNKKFAKSQSDRKGPCE